MAMVNVCVTARHAFNPHYSINVEGLSYGLIQEGCQTLHRMYFQNRIRLYLHNISLSSHQTTFDVGEILVDPPLLVHVNKSEDSRHDLVSQEFHCQRYITLTGVSALRARLEH